MGGTKQVNCGESVENISIHLITCAYHRMLFYPKSKIVFSFFPALPICLLKSVAYLQSLLAYISKTPAKLVESLPSSFDLWIFWAKSLDLFLLNCLLGPIKFALIAFFL